MIDGVLMPRGAKRQPVRAAEREHVVDLVRPDAVQARPDLDPGIQAKVLERGVPYERPEGA